MKTFLIIFASALAISFIIVAFTREGSPTKKIAGYATNDPNAPRIEIQEKKYDFGKINLNDAAKHDFLVTNTGKNPLILNDIMTSCHCTSAVLKIAGQPDSPEFGMHQDSNWQAEVASGSNATLEVIYKPAVMPVKGQVSRVVTLSTNDPQNKEIQVEITAEVL